MTNLLSSNCWKLVARYVMKTVIGSETITGDFRNRGFGQVFLIFDHRGAREQLPRGRSGETAGIVNFISPFRRRNARARAEVVQQLK